MRTTGYGESLVICYWADSDGLEVRHTCRAQLEL
jgi:hypothetical protein